MLQQLHRAPSRGAAPTKRAEKGRSSSIPPSTHLRHVPGLVAVAGAGEDSGPDVLPAERGRVLQPAEQAVGALPGLGEDDAARSSQGLEMFLQDLLQLAQPGVLIALVPSERPQGRPVLCAGKRGVMGAPHPLNAASTDPPPRPLCYPQTVQ